MTDGLSHDGSYANLELGSVLKAIRGGQGVDFDQIYRPRTTRDDPTQSFRYPPPLAEAVVRAVRKLEHLYLYPSDFYIDWATKGLMYCAAQEVELRPLINPAITIAREAAEQGEIESMQAFIGEADDRLRRSQGPEHRERMRERLSDMLDTCKARGFLENAEAIRRVLDKHPRGLD